MPDPKRIGARDLQVWMLGLAIAVTLLGACGSRQRTSQPDPGDAAHGEEQMLALPWRRGERFYLRTLTFRGEVTTRDSVRLARDHRLEFIPLTLDPVGAGGCTLETYAVSDDEAWLLNAREPIALARPGRDEEVAAFLSHRVRVDLAPYAGQTLRLRWALSGAGCGTTGGIGNLKLYSSNSDPGSTPDILFVGSDTHRYDHALAGRGIDLMPNLQQLRREPGAVSYHHAYSTASWTAPAVASLLTGRFPREHGTGRRTWSSNENGELNVNDSPPGYFFAPLLEGRDLVTAHPAALTTLGERLAKLGYTTVFIFANGLFKISGLWRDGQDIAVDASIWRGEQLTALAEKILVALPDDRPIFLLVHYMDVHHYEPWYFRPHHGDDSVRDHPDAMRSSYAKAVIDTDQQLDALLSIWDKEVGLAESLVVFYSDHGEHLLDNAESPRIDHGNTMEDVLLRIPLVIKYPAHFDTGERDVEHPVSLVDVIPTVLDLVGLKKPAELPGISLLDRAQLANRADRPLYADFQLYEREMSSVRSGPFKLVLDLDTSRTTLIDSRQPYTDTGEDGQVVVDALREERLRAAYEAYVDHAAALTDGLRSDSIVDRGESIEKLRALGYVE